MGKRKKEILGDAKSLYQCEVRKDRMFKFRLGSQRKILDKRHTAIRKVEIY